MRPAPSFAPVDSLTVHPWPDPVIDALGHHPCSSYVEDFWLGVLGPSTTFLLRHLVTTLEASPDGFSLSLPVTARRLGLGDKGGRHSPFMRSLARLVQFELAQLEDDETLAVRRRVPPLNRHQVLRLPELLQAAHKRWQDEQLHAPPGEVMRRRGRQLALSYLEAGLEAGETERQLLRLGYHPAMASECSRWASSRREEAAALVD
ncbi:MAG: hypothetical protein KY439_05605 [Actinobacteria bacterium]|nr:hypothetical protein [Actinomycetota bacterium]